MNGIYLIKGTVKNYDWGGFSFIPALLKQENKSETPFAEYWMGCHSQGDAWVKVEDDVSIKLSQLCGMLPFLLKVLDVRNMLSIQLHPDKESAQQGFARENDARIPLSASNRNYKDENHKPELMVALSEFWLLHGFKSREELKDTLTNVSELNELLPLYQEKGNEGLFQYIMEMPQDEVNRILRPLIDKITPEFNNGNLNKNSADHWAAKAAIHFSKNGNTDRGIFSIYFLNLVHLKAGEAIFQGPGIPHAYLEGQNVEIMANSDNVLRGGLTSKHIDVKELLKNINSASITPNIIDPEANGKGKNYKTTAEEFRLTMFELKPGEKIELEIIEPGILLLTNGSARISGSNRTVQLEKGQPSAMVLPVDKITIDAMENTVLFHASGPVNSGV